MENWIQQSFKGFDDNMALLRRIYGLEPGREGRPDCGELWGKAQRDFAESFKDYLNLLGVVLREDYLTLQGWNPPSNSGLPPRQHGRSLHQANRTYPACP